MGRDVADLGLCSRLHVHRLRSGNEFFHFGRGRLVVDERHRPDAAGFDAGGLETLRRAVRAERAVFRAPGLMLLPGFEVANGERRLAAEVVGDA